MENLGEEEAESAVFIVIAFIEFRVLLCSSAREFSDEEQKELAPCRGKFCFKAPQEQTRLLALCRFCARRRHTYTRTHTHSLALFSLLSGVIAWWCCLVLVHSSSFSSQKHQLQSFLFRRENDETNESRALLRVVRFRRLFRRRRLLLLLLIIINRKKRRQESLYATTRSVAEKL